MIDLGDALTKSGIRPAGVYGQLKPNTEVETYNYLGRRGVVYGQLKPNTESNAAVCNYDTLPFYLLL